LHICVLTKHQFGTMKIAFDAKRAYSNSTGLGHYSRTLISSLSEFFPEHEYFLCTPKLSKRFNVENLKHVYAVTPQHLPSSFFTSAWRSSWVKKDLQRLKIDLYHGLSSEIPVGIEKTGIKSVVTIHDLIFERFPDQYNKIDVQIYRKKSRYACEHADKIIAISEQTKKDIIQLYKIPGNKITVCYQSCNPAFGLEVSDTEKQRIKQQYNLPAKFFLYVGSIIERKNLLTVCKAMQQLKNTLNIPLVVIGEGKKYKRRVKEFINTHSLQSQIIFLSEIQSLRSLKSFQSSFDFPAIYQQALCMIYPSIFEGFGIPVLEALWSKIPVITSNISSLPEAGGDGALYVDPLNEEQMANAMLGIYGNTELRKELINKGRLYAQNFTHEKTAACVMDVYKSSMQ
jgi:glycosyltransferase involved in cell wall biosynthesis